MEEIEVNINNMIDITHTLYQGMPVYPGVPDFTIKEISNVEKDLSESHLLCLLTHHGTHLDTPFHMIINGLTTNDFSKEYLFTKAVILNFESRLPNYIISANDIKQFYNEIIGYEAIIFDTGWSKRRGKSEEYFTSWIGLSEDATALLSKIERLKIVGIDGLSIAPPPSVSSIQEIVKIHKNLLERNIFIIEELNLSPLSELINGSKIIEGILLVAPLKLELMDGSPSRVLFFSTKKN